MARHSAYVRGMKRHALVFAILLSAAPVAAQEEAPDGFSLMEEGAKLLFRGLMQEMEPALDEFQELAEELGPQLREFAREMGPALRDLLGEIEDWSVYHPPEMLPNGDIILRRKTPDELVPQPGDEIEL